VLFIEGCFGEEVEVEVEDVGYVLCYCVFVY